MDAPRQNVGVCCDGRASGSIHRIEKGCFHGTGYTTKLSRNQYRIFTGGASDAQQTSPKGNVSAEGKVRLGGLGGFRYA
jgi:hypothetical protein